MTMDVSHRKIEQLKSEVSVVSDNEQTIPKVTTSIKRPFDVAFLMLPDEKLKQKHKLSKNTPELCCHNNNNEKLVELDVDEVDEDEEIEVGNHQDFKLIQHPKYFTQKQQIFDDPNLIKARNLDELRARCNLMASHSSSEHQQKSAFTKVNFLGKDSTMRASPNLSLSPDLSYQNSLSPSPPIINRNYQNFPNNILSSTSSSPNQIFKNQQLISAAYQGNNSFLPEHFNNPNNINNLDNNNPFLIKTSHNPELMQQHHQHHLHKLRPVYRPDLPSGIVYNYQQFSNEEMLKIGGPNIRNPAAAILTTLLPPSLAALSLPAQNVCAKCNITFRMTSDLVYHMRSHHKNDSVDFSNRKRREDKLKCPVCAESFRERHHLTRHMTAHQDKDEEENDTIKKKGF